MVAKRDEVRTNIRVPADLYARLAAQAKRNRRSINSELIVLIERGLEPEKQPRK